MLHVNNLNVCYGDAQALWDVTFHVPKGEIVALVGANGAGKTTTLRAISNLLKPRSGDIRIDGVLSSGLPGFQVAAKGVAHVPEARQLFPLMTVQENLMMGSVLREAKAKRAETLGEVFEIFPKLHERRKQLAETLSGGEQQMLAIGRGLMLRPKILLLDEPSLGLAPKIVDKIYEVIKDVNQKGISILLVEQNIQRALELAQKAYVLENGRVAMSGNGRELLQDDHIRKAYLGI